MSKFSIEIEEVLQRVEEIEADNLEEALDIVEEKYNNGEIELDYEDFKGKEIKEYISGVRLEDLEKDKIFDIKYGQAIMLEGNNNLALIKQFGKEFEPYIIVTNLKPNPNTHVYFEWDNGTRFNSLIEASKEYEKRININQHFNDIDFSRLGKCTLENNCIAVFDDVHEIFDYLVDEEMNKEEIVSMLPDDMKDKLILNLSDTTRKEGNQYFYADDMFCLEEQIEEQLSEIDEILKELKLDKVDPYKVIELIEEKNIGKISPKLEMDILKEIEESMSDYKGTIETLANYIEEQMKDFQEEEEDEL